MAPRGTSTWRRPYTSIYNDNYRYGTNLYSGTLSDIQKKYTDSMSKTQLRSDRPDLKLTTFSDLGPSAARDTNPTVNLPTPLPPSPTREFTSSYHGSIFESMLNSALHSSYATDVEEKTAVERRPASRASEQAQPTSRPAIVEMPRPTSLYDDAGLFTLKKVAETTEVEDTNSRKKKKPIIKEVASPVTPNPQNGPSEAFWKDKCRDLQCQADMLTQAMADMSTKLKGELSTTKGKLQTEVGDLHISLEQSSQQSNELQKTVKKQASQLMELQTAYEDLQRHLQDSLDEIGGFQRRNQTLRKEMDRLRAEVEETIERGANRL